MRSTCSPSLNSGRGAFVFEKLVPGSVVAGGDPNVLIYVSIGTVPMGWVAAVDFIQQTWCVRSRTSLRRALPPRRGAKGSGISSWTRATTSSSPSTRGKRLVRALGGLVLGGEIDGVRGLLSHNRGKGLELFARYVAFLGEEHWTGQGLQQIVGYFSFACGFRRPLFSVLAETFAEATAYSPLVPFTPSDAAVLEILLSALLIRLRSPTSGPPSRAPSAQATPPSAPEPQPKLRPSAQNVTFGCRSLRRRMRRR